MTMCNNPYTTKVTSITDQIYLVVKGSVGICVAHYKNVSMVIDDGHVMPDGLPFCALIHTHEDESSAYKKCMYLIGKMCKKQTSSKYFEFHKWEEHLKNGDFDKASHEEIVAAVKYVKEMIDEYYRKVCC